MEKLIGKASDGTRMEIESPWMNQNGGGVAAWIRLFKKRMAKTSLPCPVLWFPEADILPFFYPAYSRVAWSTLRLFPLTVSLIHTANNSNLQIIEDGKIFSMYHQKKIVWYACKIWDRGGVLIREAGKSVAMRLMAMVMDCPRYFGALFFVE